MPRGRAYFTGDQAKDGAQPAGGAEAPPAASAPAAASASAASATTASASSSRVVRPSSSRSKSATGPRKTEGRNSGAGLDEGEETVLGEIEGGGVGGAGLAGETSQAKSSLLGKKKKDPSRSAAAAAAAGAGAGAGGDNDGDDLVDTDEDEGERSARSRSRVSARGSRGTAASTSFIGGEDIYTYDSDSTDDSGDGSTCGRPVWSDHAPARLPLPPPRTYGGHQHFNYDCQRGAAQKDSSIRPAGAAAAAAGAAAPAGPPVPDVVGSSLAEEKKGDEGQGNVVDEDAPAPVFLNLATASAQDRKIEADTWTVFKLPTRLPHIAPKAGVKSEFGGDGMMPMKMDPDEQQQAEQPQRYPGAPAPVGNRFDDSLRTAPAGRYGKIRIHQSGKAVLVIGEGTPEEVTLNLNEGIPCSMLQHAVNIDPTEATYVNMGEVHHSIVATPDIESAFAGR